LTRSAKRSPCAGLAFEKTALVVLVSEALAERKLDLPEHVMAWMDERAVELADMTFLYDESLLASVRFTVAVSAWRVEGSAVALLETAHSSMEPLAEAPEALVTVILTSFNRPEMLRQAVASVRAQTYKNIELIVVDDGSTVPQMTEVLAQLEREKVHVVRQENQYLGAARNNGARIAKGMYLLFLDDDNLVLPTMVSTLVTAARRSDSKIAVNAHYIWRASDIATMPAAADLASMKVWCPVGPAVMAGLKGNVFGNANFLIVKETFYALSGFTEDRAGWEDYEFHAKSAIAGVAYVVVPEPLMLYRIHNNREQMSQIANSLNFHRVMRAYKSLLEESSNVMRGDYISDERFNGERQVTLCTVLNVTGTCTSFTIFVEATANPGTSYLGGTTTASVSVSGVPLAGSTYQSFPPSGATDAGTWRITGTPPVTITPSVVFPVTVEFTGGISCTLQVQPGAVNCAGTCFHKDTVVTYEGREMGRRELEKHSDCRVPHVVRAVGVAVHTTCAAKPLRLTSDHLVFTARGTRAAGSLAAGDVVFGDLEQQRPCTVKSVVRESEEQEYFGLNCLRSAVLADKVKTSTFGNLHVLPSLWMSYVGRIFGIERASVWGDKLSGWAHRANLL
jgi:glycosyltransferase involved in cell wall biosynthesis